MRWDNLRIEGEAGMRLPGYEDGAVVRTFDAPEALDTRFYEVNARSALNRVPERSRMPFRWTINPYRGCTHACSYCLSGDTPILMGDGRARPLAELRPGDAVYGTVRRGAYRRYTLTRVLDHWSTVKPAYRLTLEDGTELVASGDHRFLTERGWKHVAGTEQGRGRRPHLTTNNTLMGTGAYVATPAASFDYRRGYLRGVIRGDGHVGSYSYARPGRTSTDVHRFRLALTDLEALMRAKEYLVQAGVVTDEFLLQEAGALGDSREIRAIRTSAAARVGTIKKSIEWPGRASDDWCRGFLAGIFDAEGSHGHCIRIADTDRTIIDWTSWCLRRFGFGSVIEQARHKPLMYARVRGGQREKLRFFHAFDPAITGKRSVEGIGIESNAQLGVASIERLPGARPLYDITTETGDFIANGVVSHNCFARPTHTYLDFDAGRDFEREIVVKVNVPELVRAELSKPSWRREHVALGTNTDPYQWVEGRYRLTHGVWEAMRDYSNPCSVLTKSPLLLRDLALFRELVERTEFVANLSVPTLDEAAWRASEPHTPHPRKRLEAAAELVRAGIPVGILIAPLMPGINDSPAQVERILELAGEAGVTSVGGIALHLRGEVREVFFDWLRQYRPDLVPRYEELYGRGAYAPKQEQRRLSALVRRDGLAGRRYVRGADTGERPARSPAPVRQGSLF